MMDPERKLVKTEESEDALSNAVNAHTWQQVETSVFLARFFLDRPLFSTEYLVVVLRTGSEL